MLLSLGFSTQPAWVIFVGHFRGGTSCQWRGSLWGPLRAWVLGMRATRGLEVDRARSIGVARPCGTACGGACHGGPGGLQVDRMRRFAPSPSSREPRSRPPPAAAQDGPHVYFGALTGRLRVSASSSSSPLSSSIEDRRPMFVFACFANLRRNLPQSEADSGGFSPND